MTVSLAATVEAAHRDNACRIFRALTFLEGSPLAGIPLDESPDPGATFGIPLSPSGNPSPTHWGTMFTGSTAQVVHNIILNGFPEGVDWQAFNLTRNKASQAWNTIDIRPSDSWDFSAEWNTYLSQKGVKKIEDDAA